MRRGGSVLLACLLVACQTTPNPTPSPAPLPTVVPIPTATPLPTPTGTPIPSPSASPIAGVVDPAAALQIGPPFGLDRLTALETAQISEEMKSLATELASAAGSEYSAGDFPIGVRFVTRDADIAGLVMLLGLPPELTQIPGILSAAAEGAASNTGAELSYTTIGSHRVAVLTGPSSATITMLHGHLLMALGADAADPGLALMRSLIAFNRSFGAIDALVAEAQAEGSLTVIALPHDWCGYGDIIDAYEETFGITVNELEPNGSSNDELVALRTTRSQTGPNVPDVVDVGLRVAVTANAEGLLAPYKVATWDAIPAASKEQGGHWYGDYGGMITFEVNVSAVDHVPATWADLLKPEYEGQIALTGDPGTAVQARYALWAAAYAVTGTLDDPGAGVTFFKKLARNGNLRDTAASSADVVEGTVPIRLAWDYLTVPDRKDFAGVTKIAVVNPKKGRLQSIYAQAINVNAQHPKAARLWMEYLFSPAGQNAFLRGYCHPIQTAAMIEAGTIDEAALAGMPSLGGSVTPTLAQITHAEAVINDRWADALFPIR